MRRGWGSCFCCRDGLGAFALPEVMGGRLVCLACLLDLRDDFDLRDLPRPPPPPAQADLPLYWTVPPLRVLEPPEPSPGAWRRTTRNVTASARGTLPAHRRTAR